ncbi:MAG: MerR family transcriptional regulator [Bacteroidales bacterium]|nr:MerR family transcriptional regulator [Bacteroidales bacterium]
MEDKFCYSIKEVAEEFNLTYPTLRFWETQFRQIKPIKNKRGVRYYNKETIEIIQTIVYLTRQKGYTLDGVKKYIAGSKLDTAEKKAYITQTLTELKQTLLNIKQGLNND